MLPMSSPTAGHRSRRSLLFAALSFAVVLSSPSLAGAASANVRWMPSITSNVIRYDVYVRNAGAPFAAKPAWSGNPLPDDSGVLSAIVPFTPAVSGANYFAVVAVSGTAASALSRELGTGSPIACHVD